MNCVRYAPGDGIEDKKRLKCFLIEHCLAGGGYSGDVGPRTAAHGNVSACGFRCKPNKPLMSNLIHSRPANESLWPPTTIQDTTQLLRAIGG
jgi:hypothetical protein